MDNEAINSKKGTKWKPGDDLTLQIEGHALPSCRHIEHMVNEGGSGNALRRPVGGVSYDITKIIIIIESFIV